MIIENLKIKYIIKKPYKKIKKPPLFLMLHGYGSNEKDMLHLTNKIPSNFFIISLRGIYSLPFGGYSWFKINFSEKKNPNINIKEAIISQKKINNFIKKAVLKYNLDFNNIWICGFSQGAILSYSIAFNNNFKKIIILSGFLHEKFYLNKKINNLKKTEFFISHGINDEIIPIDWARKSKIILENNKIKHTYNEYLESHKINEKNYKDLIKWIKNKNAEI